MANIEDDMKLYYQWKEAPSKRNFQRLYRGFGGLINTASQKASYGSTLPRAAFKLQAAQEFHNALGNFKPDVGVKLSTYLYKSVNEKLKRLNYKYPNLARISERSGEGLGVYHINEYQNTKAILHQQLNREPSAVEMAKEMNVTPDKVTQLEQEIRKDLSLSADLEDMVAFDDMSAVKSFVAMHYYDMSPEEQILYDYVEGDHGKQAILKKNEQPDYKAIAIRMNISDARITKLRKKLAQRFDEVNY